MFEQLVADYRSGLSNLENEASGSSDSSVEHLKQRLQAKEDELRKKFDEESSQILVNAKVDPQFVTLREELQN